MSIRLAVASSDSEYLERFCGKIQDFDELQLSIFENKDNLEESLQKKRYDVLLFTPDIYSGECPGERVSIKIMLFDEDDDVVGAYPGVIKVRRYQRISFIYQELLDAYSELGRPVSGGTGGRATKLVAFYSPVGGSGKTTIALATATRMAREGRSVFYVNMEDIPSDEVYLHNTFEKGMTDLLHGIGNNANAQAKLKGIMQCKNDNLYYAKHFDSPNDLKELTVDEVGDLLFAIRSSGLFDCVVVDLYTKFDEKISKVFEVSDEIVIVERGDEMSESKMTTFYGQIHIISEYGHKMKRVVNFYTGRSLQVHTDIEKIGDVYMTQVADTEVFIDQLAGNPQMSFATNIML